MTKKELIEMLSDIPDNAIVCITRESYSLIGNSISPININGYYENSSGIYILSAMNVRPNKLSESND